MKKRGVDSLNEIYKVQVAIIGGPSILIYNESRTQMYETTNMEEINAIRKFIGGNEVKRYVEGYQNKEGQIVIEKLIPIRISKEYDW